MEQTVAPIPLIESGFFMRERIRDIVIALFLAVSLFPVMVFIGAVIFLAFGRPVLYSEKRVGLGGRLFTIYKFRTLNGRWRSSDDLSGRILKNGTPENCRRPFFRVLRRYSLDELPQVMNVLAGDMSIVGPWRLSPGWMPPVSFFQGKGLTDGKNT